MPSGGHKQSETTREKIRNFFKGKKLSEDHKAKIKKNNAHYWLGKANNHKGIGYDDTVKKKMSDSKKNFYKNGGIHALKGTHRSLETRLKLSKKLNRGLSTENHKIRNGIECSLWRESIFARDNWTCQKYGVRGGKLRAHHIKNFAQFPELRFAIDNGITLSEKAHKEFHKKYGARNNNEEQLIEFLE